MTNYQQTLDDLNLALSQNPNRVQALARRGEIYCQQKQYSQALADFSRIIALKPAYAWAYAHRGETYCLLERYEEALADFDRAIELDPTYVWAIAHRGNTYRLRGRSYFPQALADFNQAIELDSNYAWAYACRAEIYLIQQQYQAALVDFDRSVALDETLFGSYWRAGRGLVLLYTRQYAQTIQWYQQALTGIPGHFIALYGLAVAKARYHGPADAQADIAAARQAAQANLETTYHDNALYRLAGLAALESRDDEALAYLQEAVALGGEAAEMARHDPAWDNLRADPRFQALLATVHF